MKRFSVALVGLLISGLIVLPTSNAADSVVQPRAYEEISRCLNSKNVLNVFFLVDSSSSLLDTDPDDKRAEVLSSALTQFATARESAQVNFSLGTFGERYTTQYPWTRVNGKGLAAATDWLETEIPTLDNEGATDWLAGIRNATKALNAAPKSTESCKIMLWLTDGGINVPGTSKDVDSDAIQTLCGVNPATGASISASLMDSIRRSGITVIGVLLKSTRYLEEKRDAEPTEYASQVSRMSYMRSIVESTGQVDGSYFGQGKLQFVCGKSPIPASSAAGVLVEVNDARDLGLNFARIWLNASGGQPGTVVGTSPFEFLVEPGISSVTVLIQANEWSLRDPAGNTVLRSNDKDARILKTGNVYQVSVDTSTTAAQGKWTGTGPTLVELFLYSNLAIDLETKIEFGLPAQISGQVLDKNGDPVGLSDYGTANVSVVVIADGVDNQPVPLELDLTTGQFNGVFSPPPGVTRAIFDVTLELTTKSGQKLKPIEQRVEKDVALGAEYPSLSPALVQFSELAGPNGTATGTLNIVGSAQGPSKVCFVDATVLHDPLPERIAEYKWSTDGKNDCVAVAPGQSQILKVSVANSRPAEGLVDGTLGISVTPENGQTRELRVPFDMQTTWPPNELVRTLVLVTLSLLSILLPWLVLHIVNVRNSRLVAGSLMKRVELPVLVSSMGVRGPVTPESKNPTGLDLYAKDYNFFGVEDRPREYRDTSGVTISGKAPLNPFGTPKVVVTPTTGNQVITKPLMDTDLGGAWMVVVSNAELLAANGAEVSGRLVSFIRTTGDDVALAQTRVNEISASAVWQNMSSFVDAANLENTRAQRAETPRQRRKLGKTESDAAISPIADDVWGAHGTASNSTGSPSTSALSTDPWGSGSSGTTPTNSNNDDTGFDWSR